MSVKKLTIEEIPKDVLGDLQTLVSDSKKEYIVVGTTYYCLEPMPAIKLMEVLGKFMETLEGVRRQVIESMMAELPPDKQSSFDSNSVIITIRDLLKDEDVIKVVKGLLSKVLEGVDSKDFDNITTNQLVRVVDSVIKINIETLPQSFREALLPGSTLGEQEDTPTAEEGQAEVEDPTKNP